MTDDDPSPRRLTDAGRYKIRLAGHLDTRWAAWFDGLTVVGADDGTTVISGPVSDQAALHGLLQRVRDLGLPLVSVARLDDRAVDQAGDHVNDTTSTTTHEGRTP